MARIHTGEIVVSAECDMRYIHLELSSAAGVVQSTCESFQLHALIDTDHIQASDAHQQQV